MHKIQFTLLFFNYVQITLADFSVVTVLSSSDAFLPVTQSWPNLNNWYRTMKNLPYYNANLPGLNALKMGLRASTDYPINMN